MTKDTFRQQLDLTITALSKIRKESEEHADTDINQLPVNDWFESLSEHASQLITLANAVNPNIIDTDLGG